MTGPLTYNVVVCQSTVFRVTPPVGQGSIAINHQVSRDAMKKTADLYHGAGGPAVGTDVVVV